MILNKLPLKPLKLTLLILLLAGAGIHTPAHCQAWENARKVMTPELIREYVNFLASDSLKGRITPSPELDAAGKYIARQFNVAHLHGFEGDYFRDLDYCYFDLGPNVFLTVVKDPVVRNFELKKDFVPFAFSGTTPAEGKVVFAGYGISAPEYNYDDYQDIDVTGKIVAILRQEPGQADSGLQRSRGLKFARYAGLHEKMKNAKAHGALGMLVINGPVNDPFCSPHGYSWPSFSENEPKGKLPLLSCSESATNLPVVAIGVEVINELFGSIDSLKRVQQRIDRRMQPESFAVPGKVFALNVDLIARPFGGKNVIGFIQGCDPSLKQEAIIIGAHYDHLGILKGKDVKGDSILNGADDNASGTSGMMAIAKAFASMQERPKRSVIFIAFAGEEKGFLGSASYVAHPLWPLDKTVAMLDLDMISRNDPAMLEIIGARQNPGLMRIINKVSKKEGFILKPSQSKHMGGGSDHISFYNKGIPSVMIFTGLHGDYHRVTDEPDKIDAEKAARVARVAFMTAWKIANERSHYKVILPKTDDR